jgi:hypothetical protein
MKSPRRITLHIENFRGTLEITCEKCNAPTRIQLENVSELPIQCECGLSYSLSEIEIKDAHKSLEDIRLLWKDFQGSGNFT